MHKEHEEPENYSFGFKTCRVCDKPYTACRLTSLFSGSGEMTKWYEEVSGLSIMRDYFMKHHALICEDCPARLQAAAQLRQSLRLKERGYFQPLRDAAAAERASTSRLPEVKIEPETRGYNANECFGIVPWQQEEVDGDIAKFEEKLKILHRDLDDLDFSRKITKQDEKIFVECPMCLTKIGLMVDHRKNGYKNYIVTNWRKHFRTQHEY